MNVQKINDYFYKITKNGTYIDFEINGEILFGILKDGKTINISVNSETKKQILELEKSIRDTINKYGTNVFKTSLRGHMLKVKIYQKEIDILIDGKYETREIMTKQINGLLFLRVKGLYLNNNFIQPCFELLKINGNYNFEKDKNKP